MSYIAIINTPGYLPEQDDPPIFDTAREAWDYLADERREHEDEAWESNNDLPDGYSATLNTIEELSRGNFDPALGAAPDADGTGIVIGPTPGYTGDHDLGLAYSVEVAE